MSEQPDDQDDAATDIPETDFSVLRLPIPPGQWRDADERMFQACFAILGQYVEDELGTEVFGYQKGHEEECLHRGYRLHAADMDGEPSRDRAAIDLWLWYRDELPVLKKAYADDINECYSGKMKTVPVQLGTETVHRVVDFGQVREPKFEHDWPGTVKDRKLRELIDLRRCLWT